MTFAELIEGLKALNKIPQIAEDVAIIRSNQEQMTTNQGEIMAQVDLLRSAIQENASAAAQAVARVEAKLAQLGDPDPDLTADIQTLRDATAQIQTIADPSTPDPGDADFNPGPVVDAGTGGTTDGPAPEGTDDGDTVVDDEA